jgi:DNA polymerase
MHVVAVDFETYYDADHTISKQGMIGYIEDPNFNPYMVSIVGTGKNGNKVAYSGAPDEAPWEEVEGVVWVSHNMAFDGYVWKYMTEHRGAPWGKGPCEWNCTADLAVYCHGPRSLAASVRTLMPDIVGHGKDMRSWAKGKTPEEIKAAGKWEDMVTYALADSQECLELWLRFSEFWPEHERELSRLTAQWGWCGVQLDEPKLRKAVKELQDLALDARAQIPWSGEMPPLSPHALVAYCVEQGIPAPPSTSMENADCAEWESKYGEEHPCVDGMRKFRRVNKMLALLETMLRLMRPNGTLPYAIKYYGAHTGRWSGGAERDNTDTPKTLNMQNIYAQNLFGFNIREMFIPRPGYKMVICDLSQIEPRCLAWLTDQNEFMEYVARGQSPYEAHARLTMGYKSEAPLKQEDPAMYKLAKARVLALGYGAGAERFRGMAEKAGVELSEAESSKTVKSYRSSNPEITGFWRKLDQGFKKTCRDASKTFFELVLPSGRSLVYFEPKAEVLKTGKEKMKHVFNAQTNVGGSRYNFYGGKLCENVVQACARDVFAELMLRVHNWASTNDSRILWHVHDEVIVEVPEENADRSCKEIESIMGGDISWLPGCPIAAEASVENHYTK